MCRHIHTLPSSHSPAARPCARRVSISHYEYHIRATLMNILPFSNLPRSPPYPEPRRPDAIASHPRPLSPSPLRHTDFAANCQSDDPTHQVTSLPPETSRVRHDDACCITLLRLRPHTLVSSPHLSDCRTCFRIPCKSSLPESSYLLSLTSFSLHQPVVVRPCF